MKIYRGVAAAIAIVAGLLTGGVAMAQAVTFTKETKLRAEPKFDAAVLTEVSANTAGEAIGRKSPWLNIKVNNTVGWALTVDVNFGTTGVKSSGGTDLSGLFGRRQQASNTSTIGIRGFDKDTIGVALNEDSKPDAEQLRTLDGYAVDKTKAQEFAHARPLAPVSVSYSK